MNTTYEIPDIICYPEFYDVKSNLRFFNGVYSCFVEPYELVGLSVYIGFRSGRMVLRCADFKSNLINPAEIYNENLLKIIDIIKIIKISDVCLYFSGGLLVDVMLAANKFMSPGMLNDIFKSIGVQKIIGIGIVNDENISKYSSCYVKPNRFRYQMENKVVKPLYGVI